MEGVVRQGPFVPERRVLAFPDVDRPVHASRVVLRGATNKGGDDVAGVAVEVVASSVVAGGGLGRAPAGPPHPATPATGTSGTRLGVASHLRDPVRHRDHIAVPYASW